MEKRFGNLEGVNAPDNLVNLTEEQHTQAHWFCYELNRDEFDRIASLSLCGAIGKEDIRRELGRRVGKLRRGQPSSNGHAGLHHSLDTRARLSEHFRRFFKEHPEKLRAAGWQAISPVGELFHFRNLRDFCRKNHLQQGNMVQVSKGTRQHHRGWTCKKETI